MHTFIDTERKIKKVYLYRYRKTEGKTERKILRLCTPIYIQHSR